MHLLELKEPVPNPKNNFIDTLDLGGIRTQTFGHWSRVSVLYHYDIDKKNQTSLKFESTKNVSFTEKTHLKDTKYRNFYSKSSTSRKQKEELQSFINAASPRTSKIVLFRLSMYWRITLGINQSKIKIISQAKACKIRIFLNWTWPDWSWFSIHFRGINSQVR